MNVLMRGFKGNSAFRLPEALFRFVSNAQYMRARTAYTCSPNAFHFSHVPTECFDVVRFVVLFGLPPLKRINFQRITLHARDDVDAFYI